MIERYTLPEMGAIWSEEAKFKTWLEVELAVCEAWHQLGKIPRSSLKEIKTKANFSVERITEIENVVKHDMIAFLTAVAEKVGPSSRYIHLGLTSYDIVDTALSLSIRKSIDLILLKLHQLKKLLKKQAIKYKNTICMGRTHGVHAEPVTFGFKVLIWYDEIKRNIARMEHVRETISFGRISGAVGTYVHLNPEVEKIALRKLKLKPAPVSNQVLQRDLHADVLSALAIVASTLDKIATEVRHLQRTEVLELEEPFTKGQKGSSAMPHKKNPVRCERISGLARIVRANVQVALENIPLWHERDISHSSTERVIFPDSFILTDYLLAETIDIVSQWVVHPDRMKANVEQTRGLIFSQRVMLALTDTGMTREDAYQLIQRNSLKAWNEGQDFRTLVKSDPDIRKQLDPAQLEKCFSYDLYLEKIGYIFERVLSDES